ncbi:MAG: sigma-70 family RNA polymerase sigma factor [Candidatus Eisenbacteria sp.]|nr:sigma-70 family RNA polymerase sigma factor [Candidatus Eisenbacteria bacterium]
MPERIDVQGNASGLEPGPKSRVGPDGSNRTHPPGAMVEPVLAELPDEDLMEKIVEGSERAFALLVKRYQGKIMNLVHRFIYDRDRAAEIAQEVFLRVYLHRKRYRRSGRFSTWIYTIAANLAKNEIRRKARLKGVLSLDSLLEATGDSASFLADRQPGPEHTAHQHQVEEIVMAAIHKLPLKYREVILLRDIQQLTYEEIEQVLNIPGGTVRSRINRARNALKEMLEPILGRRRVP